MSKDSFSISILYLNEDSLHPFSPLTVAKPYSTNLNSDKFPLLANTFSTILAEEFCLKRTLISHDF